MRVVGVSLRNMEACTSPKSKNLHSSPPRLCLFDGNEMGRTWWKRRSHLHPCRKIGVWYGDGLREMNGLMAQRLVFLIQDRQT